MGKRKKRYAILPNKNRTFWKQCVVWGIATGTILGSLAAMIGSYRSNSEFVSFGIVGFLIGFATGFLLKAIDKLPLKEGEFSFRSRIDLGGSTRQPDVDEIIPDWEERK
jgi:hypothetical protein